MKKLLHISETETSVSPKTEALRIPGSLAGFASQEISAEYTDHGICHHLNAELFAALIQYEGQNARNICICAPAAFGSQLRDTVSPYHCNDFVELIYVLQGQLTLTVEQKTHTFSEHDLFLLCPSVFYEELWDSSRGVVLAVRLRTDFFEDALLADEPDCLQGFRCRCLQKELERQRFLHLSPASESEKKSMSGLFSELVWELKGRQAGYRQIVRGILARIFSFLSRTCPIPYSEEERRTYRRYLFEEVNRFMRQNHFDLQMSDLTEQFHYQSNYFNKLIHEFTGKSYSEHLIAIRLSIARELLEKTDAGVGDIMHYIGYNNKGFFYQNFREQYGTTPAVYRKNLRKAKAAEAAAHKHSQTSGQLSGICTQNGHNFPVE